MLTSKSLKTLKEKCPTHVKNGIAKFVMFRLLSYLVLSAISFKPVQDFFLRLFDMLTVFSASIGVELFSAPGGFLGADLFLFLLFDSNKVVPVFTNGVTGPSVVGISFANAGEAISSVLLIPSLSPVTFSKLVHFRSPDFAGSDFKDVLAFEGHISFICPFGVPLFRFQCEQK